MLSVFVIDVAPSRDLDELTRRRSRSTDNGMSRSTPPSRNGLVGMCYSVN